MALLPLPVPRTVRIQGSRAKRIVPDETDVDWLAASTLASLQGGLILTQARRDPHLLRQALDGALALIRTYHPTS
jgi:hypothetical protein